MSLHVEVSSYLRKFLPNYNPEEGLILDFRPGMTVAQMIKDLGIPEEQVQLIMVNRMAVKPDHVLKEGDLVGLFPILDGG
jgi:sulfur carrier protein ThiS